MVRVLLFTRAVEFVHDSWIPITELLVAQCQSRGFTVTKSDDASLFKQPSLSDSFDVIVFVQTSGMILSEEQVEAFRQFLEGDAPKGFFGIHAAADTLRNNAWYRNMLGGVFVGHPPFQKGRLTFSQEVASGFGMELPHTIEFEDEWYNFDQNAFLLSKTQVLAVVDEDSYAHGPYEKPEWEGTKMGNPHPVIWGRQHHHSRVFYSGIGHTAASYMQPGLQDLLGDALAWCGFVVGKQKQNHPHHPHHHHHVFLQQVVRCDTSCVSIVVDEGALWAPRIYANDLVPADHKSSVHFVVSDSNVDPLYGQLVQDGLSAAGFLKTKRLVVPAGEASKSMEKYLELAGEILKSGVDKYSCVITLGGGMVNNLGGMLASTIYRGLRLVHIATSLLAQVDAAVDLKQAVNFGSGKNQIGTMYAPALVVIDSKCLATLSMKERINGMGEAIKHALAQDSEFFDFLSRHNVGHLADPSFLYRVVKKTTTLKVALLNTGQGSDMFDMIAQYGHALGHVIEHLTNYSLGHGEAIAIGMCLSAEIGLALGHCALDVVLKHYRIFRQFGLPTVLPEQLTFAMICAKLGTDKHFHDGLPRMMLLKEIGIPIVRDSVYAIPVPFQVIDAAIQTSKTRN